MITRIVVDNIINDIPFAGGFLIATIVALFGGIETLQSHIWLAGLMLVFVTTLQAFFVFVRQRFAALASERIVKRLKDELYDHIQKLPYDYHVKAQTGDLIQRCTSDVETIRIFYHSQLIEIVRAVFMVIFALGAMVSVNIRMTFVSILFLPFVFLFSFVFFRYVKKTFQSQAEKEGEMTTVLQESLSGIRVTRAFGRGRFEMERFIEKNDAYRDVSFRLIHYLGYYWSLSDFLRFTQTAIVLVYGIMQTYQGVITVGELILFNAYVQMMVWPVSQLGRVLTDTGKAQVASNRVYEVLETAAESDNENAVDYDLKGDIVFDDVSFAYEKDKKILDGLSFTVKKGETIAILGATGAGKSTLMHILLRLYDYQTGSITINGKELNLIRKDCLRSKIGMVLQEPFLYSKTIENNLRMAKESVEQDEMIKATNIAAIHDVIEDFEKGYDTLVGEKGVTLSGGQKQRVAIARTLIKNSEILIFDDSLSAVDTETDAEIRAALEKRNKDVTTFIISQRITTLMDADRIFVIDGGILADSGTHQELLGRDGLYSRIWQIQAMLEQDIKMKQSE
ncbi:MAG: ABC transporter ATP-binding protein/permease [Lachnospiraceae bacterium]|nr:ABC transporter ATP-binding protein/permease [Lachnospiraceae bacterium]